MKKLVLTVIVFIFSLTIYAQEKSDESKIMIDSAVKIKYIKYMEASKNQNTDYLENLYLIDEQDQPLNYLSSSSKLKSIQIYDDRNKKILTKGIHAWKVFTKIDKNKFIVNIVDFHITYRSHNYNFSNGGGSQTIFEYDCQNDKWRLISSQLRGN